jgi:putative Mg2+ transporter-C (MgtC) family protein
MIVSINIAMDNYLFYGLTNSDPERIAAQVITGVGFLGAGTILANQKERNVKGLTTAASIWAVAAVGLVVGAGYIVTATAATVLVFIVLTLFVRFDNLLRSRSKKQYTFHIIMKNTVSQSRRLGEFFRKKDLAMESYQSLSEEDDKYAELEVTTSSFQPVDTSEIIVALLALGGIVEVTSIQKQPKDTSKL